MNSPVKIGIIGDFDCERQSHKATNEALNHCANYLGINVESHWLPTRLLEQDTYESIRHFDGFWCAPGVYESRKGALNAIQSARENNHPFMGTCAGFQYTVIEYVRNQLGLADVQHAEYNPNASNLIITPLSCSLIGKTRKVLVEKNSMIYKYYDKAEIVERFSCTFGLNASYRQLLEDSGLKVVGTDEQGEVRILELSKNNFYIATLFQPQLSSLPANPHKLILAFLGCSKEFHFNR